MAEGLAGRSLKHAPTPGAPTPPPRDGPAPFNKRSADVVLRSSDNVDFRVRRSILVEASSFFETMFTLPQLPEDRKRKERDADAAYQGDVPIVAMAEKSFILNSLLRFCYPVDNPQLIKLKDAAAVMEAARKLEMSYATSEAKKQFSRLAEKQPLQAYICATRYNWVDEMREAAASTLRHPIDWDDYIPEMEDVSAGAWSRLQRYNKACRIAACGTLDKDVQAMTSNLILSHEDEKGKDWPWVKCICSPNFGPRSIFHRDAERLPAWFLEYIANLKRELRLRPHCSTVLETRPSPSLLSSAGCDKCKSTLPDKLEQYQLALAEEVQKKVSVVRLEIRI